MTEPPVRAFEMPEDLWAPWEALLSDARIRMEAGDGVGGLASAQRAWDALPEPKLHCSVSYITLMRLAKAFRAARAFPEGIAMMDWVLANTPFEREVPVFWVQKGILEFESGQLDAARASFAKSWKLAKEFGFTSEDPKYLAFHKSNS